jgi:plasmid stabilization system protein ParE
MSRSTASFNPQARIELKEAAAYYGLESAALRERFLMAVEEALEYVRENPEAAEIVRGNIRRKPLRRFPYSLLYTLHGHKVRILAVMHQRRRPFYWWGRE